MGNGKVIRRWSVLSSTLGCLTVIDSKVTTKKRCILYPHSLFSLTLTLARILHLFDCLKYLSHFSFYYFTLVL